jgi:hypothetical protein
MLDRLATVQSLSQTLGIPLFAGTNVYITVASIGGFQKATNIMIPGLEALASWWIVGIAGTIYLIMDLIIPLIYNIFTPSIPIDTVKKTIESFITIPASAVMMAFMASADSSNDAAAAVITAGPLISILYGAFGAFLTSMTQSLKIFIYSLIDLLPEPVSNLILSVLEGATSFIGILLIFYYPWVVLVGSILFIIFFAIFGPNILRTARINYKAIFALIKYWLNDRKSELFDRRYLEENVINQINKKAPYDQAQKILRVISGKVKGFGVNRAGYMLICPREVYIVCPALFKTRAISYKIESIAQSKYKAGFIFDSVDLLIAGSGKCQLKF